MFLDHSYCFFIEIGDNVTFSKNITLVAHDASTKKLFGYTKIGEITSGNSVFIGANVTVLLNVKIGENSIIGSGNIVTKNILATGNPSKIVCTLEECKRSKCQNLK